MNGEVESLVSRYPHLGILASLTGFGASILSVINVLSVILGFVGAIFGVIAGYFTMRCQYRKWKKAKAQDAADSNS